MLKTKHKFFKPFAFKNTFQWILLVLNQDSNNNQTLKSKHKVFKPTVQESLEIFCKFSTILPYLGEDITLIYSAEIQRKKNIGYLDFDRASIC